MPTERLKMSWIKNVSLDDIAKGHHVAAGVNSMLIQIVDPDMDFPTPKYEFKEVHRFKFLDVEEKDFVLDETWRVSSLQAETLVTILKSALESKMNVIVHCVAGICRSGAVCELGVMLGFNDTETFRSPNMLVKYKMMKHLGWTYDS